MKKFLVSMMAVITAVLLVACSNASNKDLVHVGVLQYVEHPSLSATRKGFIEELKEEGCSTYWRTPMWTKSLLEALEHATKMAAVITAIILTKNFFILYTSVFFILFYLFPISFYVLLKHWRHRENKSFIAHEKSSSLQEHPQVIQSLYLSRQK